MKVGRETCGVGKFQRDFMTMVAVELGVQGQWGVDSTRSKARKFAQDGRTETYVCSENANSRPRRGATW